MARYVEDTRQVILELLEAGPMDSYDLSKKVKKARTTVLGLLKTLEGKVMHYSNHTGNRGRARTVFELIKQ